MSNKVKDDNIIFRLNKEDKENFKIACEKAKISMSEAIGEFIENFCAIYLPKKEKGDKE